MSHRPVAPGLYGALVTRLLDHFLQTTQVPHRREVFAEPEAPELLARALHDRLMRSLRAAPARQGGTKFEMQVAVANAVLELLAQEVPAGAIEWELEREMPPGVFQEIKVAAG